MTKDELLNQLEKYPRKKVMILMRYLYTQIKSGAMRGDDVELNARDIAKHYNISEVTARRVLEELAKSDQGWNIRGKNTRPVTGRTYHIGVCIDSLMGVEQHFTYQESPFLMERDSAVRHLERLGHRITVFNTRTLHDPKADLQGIDALLTKAPPIPEMAKRLLKEKIPVVIAQVGTFEPSRFHSIAPELSDGAMAILNLWGKERPIIMATCQNRIATERFESIRYWADFMGWDLGLFQMQTMAMMPSDLGQLAGYKTGLEIVRTQKNPRIISASDYFSFGLVNAFREAQWVPKKDYELISIDNLEGMGQIPFGKPFLTVVDIRLPELYVAAADLILEILERQPTNDCLLTRRLPARFIRRETA